MTLPMRPEDPAPRPGPGPRPRPRVDAGQLWAGGVATAVVAALIAIVGILICRWLFKVPILAPQRAGAWGSASTGWYALSAAAVAIVATALMYLLAVSTPRPTSFFSWILGLATVIAVVFPFSTTAPLSQKAATAIVNLVLGFAIGTLISGVAWRAMRRPPYGPGDYPPGYPPSEVRTTHVQQRDVWR
jgi:Family of unknown function (DUF6069)